MQVRSQAGLHTVTLHSLKHGDVFRRGGVDGNIYIKTLKTEVVGNMGYVVCVAIHNGVTISLDYDTHVIPVIGEFVEFK